MPLNDTEYAGLHVKFVVPLAVSRMLRGAEALDEVAEYTINDILSGMEPDAALLCLALCAQHIALQAGHLPIARVLGVTADGVVAEYGALWLAHESGAEIDENAARGALMATPEYLEEIGDLLLTTCGALDDERHAIPAVLCDILGDQAHMHKELAEEKLAGLAVPPAPPPVETGGNVVAFPRLRR